MLVPVDATRAFPFDYALVIALKKHKSCFLLLRSKVTLCFGADRIASVTSERERRVEELFAGFKRVVIRLISGVFVDHRNKIHTIFVPIEKEATSDRAEENKVCHQADLFLLSRGKEIGRRERKSITKVRLWVHAPVFSSFRVSVIMKTIVSGQTTVSEKELKGLGLFTRRIVETAP
jgi:hypothetical protein